MAEDIYLDYRGHRFRPPFLCMCCGKEVSQEQWAFGRTCALCDTGKCQSTHPRFHPRFAHEHPTWWHSNARVMFDNFLDHTKAERLKVYAEGHEPTR